MSYRKVNVNPLKRKCVDCTTRALVVATGLSYVEVQKEQFEFASRECYGLCDRWVVGLILEKYGFYEIKLGKIKKGEKSPKVSDISDMTKDIETVAVCNVAGHIVSCVDGDVVDIWDSSDKSCYSYWIKKK